MFSCHAQRYNDFFRTVRISHETQYFRIVFFRTKAMKDNFSPSYRHRANGRIFCRTRNNWDKVFHLNLTCLSLYDKKTF